MKQIKEKLITLFRGEPAKGIPVSQIKNTVHTVSEYSPVEVKYNDWINHIYSQHLKMR